MIRRPLESQRTATPFPYTTLFRFIADPEPADSAAALGEQDDAADEEQQIGRGLHAKLLFWRTGRSRTLWLGSANATRRAWSGRNAEATLELRITEGVEVGLKALVRSEEHTSELQSLMRISYAVFCLK